MTPAKKRVSLTPNQLVADNIRRQRETRGWTQREVCDRLEPLLGNRWSPAVLSNAERSAFGRQRVREFTADELVAFSRLFGVPVVAFFQPPSPDVDFAVPDKRYGLAEAEIAAVVGTIDQASVHSQTQELVQRALIAAHRAAMDVVISVPAPMQPESAEDRELRIEAEEAIAAAIAKKEGSK